ncbi:CD209 antigen-like protein E [Myripristis murdjan]|uniref:CD209 antigen-like protein E n=1 Tax=Myripristis murdjan TaxID=586833 RepID=UPI001175FC95|nr:CD209 antigen-like protein E [Myripristis murdjan]
MEEIYVNAIHVEKGDSRTSASETGPRDSGRRFCRAALLGLGLLSVLLLAGLISLAVIYRDAVHGFAADLSILHANLTEDRSLLSSMTKERDQLNASLIGMTEERDRLHALSTQRWIMFSYGCYLLSNERNSWETARQDCRDRGADLVVIDSLEEQIFLFTFKTSVWIGLSDRDEQRTWTWVDGTPLTLSFWDYQQPNNLKKEDCVQTLTGKCENNWHDMRCSTVLPWICEKAA